MIHQKPDQQLCEDDKLIAVLRDGEDAAQHQEVVEHIEQCPRCQKRFDELAAGAQDWTKARQALLNDDPCSENRVGSAKWDYSLRNEGPVAWTESMASQLLSPASHPELLGRIGRYDVERLIGSGGMGIVFKAHDSELNRPVAIKILAPYLSSSGPARKRFAREARAAAAVVHEHVVPIYNVETEREVPFLVMHYIAGESLQGRIDREGALELCEILRIGMQVASGLSAAHQQGLVHRDIKPSNILMEQGVERALITDFGLARAADDASLTRTGFHPGTPQYMSPEQAAGEQVDARSDLFSLGSVLYTMCTGRPPFRAETSLGVLRRITDVEPRPIREINPNIPEWLCVIISKLMAKRADDRFTSAQEVAELLEDCLAHVQQPTSSPLPSSLVPHAATVRRSVSNVTRTGVMIMLGTLGISLLGMFLWQATDPPDISGQWTSDEWGTVVLKAKEPGQYEGTFNGSEKVGTANDGENNSSNKVHDKGASGTSTPQSAVEAIPPGKLHVKWSAIERRFNGNWGTGDHTKGKISLRLVDNEIRGACTSTSESRKESTSPQLTDLLWKRVKDSAVTVPPIEFDTMEKLAGNERDSAESRFANEPSWASSSVVSNNTLDGIWDVVEINWCGQVWISNGKQVLIENGKWVGFDPHETEDPTQNIRRDFAIGPDNEFCRIETDGKLRYLQPGRFRLEADQLWLAVQQCSLPSETPIHAIPTVSEPNVTYYRLRRRKAGGQEENTNVTRKQSGAKNSALFNRQTIEDITRIYNDNTAVLRRELFQPPIQDLTVEQMRAALRLAAEIETRDGRPKTGKLLEKFAESGVLSRKNGELLSYGTHEMDENGNTIARMIVPTFLIVNADGPKDERGQLDKEPVVLTSLSLSYRKNGYASQTYEYLTEAKDTLEGFLKPGRELFDKEMKQIGERLAKVVEGSAEHSLLTTKKKQLQQRWDLSVAQVKGMAAAAKAGKPVQLAPIVIPNNSRPWQAPMPDPLLGHDEDIANVLAGTWQLKRYEQDAEEASFEGSVTFSKSMMIVHLKQGDKQEELQQMYRISSEKIDIWDMDDGLDIATSLPCLGSYSIENDTLRICYHESPMEDDVPQTRPPVQPGNGFIYLELQRNIVAEKVNVAKGKTNYADLQGDWIVDSFYFDEDANSRELQKQGNTALLLRTIRVEANELFFRNPPVFGMSRISGAISIKPAEGDDSRLFQVVDSRVPGEVIRFGMYKVVGDKLTILLTRDAPPKLLAPTEGEFYIECHRAVSEQDKELLNVINKNPDQIDVIDLILKDSEKSVSAKEDTIATENVSGSEKPSATRAPDANGIYWSSRDLDHWASGLKVLHWPNAVNRNLIVEFVFRNDSPETREVDVHLYCGDKTSLLLGEGNNVSVDIKETRREKQTAVPNGIVTFKEGRAELSFEGLETGEYTLRFQRVMDLQLADEGLPHGVSRHGVPFDVSLPVKFDSSQDSLPIYWGQPVAGLRIGAMFLDSRKDHMRSFKPRDQAASQLFVQNVGSKEVECGFDPPYHSGGWGMEIADKMGNRINGAWKDEHRRVGVLIPPPPMWARLAPNEIQPISGEFTKFRVRDDDYGRTTHYEHAKFTIVAEKPEELRAHPPYDYVLPNSEYNARFSATFRKAESPDATFALESGPCPFRVGADGTTSTQDEEDVQWGLAR